MAQNENYSVVDLRIGTEAQFNAKVDTLPAGTLFGVTDSTVSKADLSTDLKNEINGKLTKPSNPSAESAVTMLADGTVGTKPLSEIGGGVTSINGQTGALRLKTVSGNSILGVGDISVSGKMYAHTITGTVTVDSKKYSFYFTLYDTKNSSTLTNSNIYNASMYNQAVVFVRVKESGTITDYCSLISSTGLSSWGFYKQNADSYITVTEYTDYVHEV